jgi:hypothetical protein
LLLLLAAELCGCGTGASGGKGAKFATSADHELAVTHEPCPLDANGAERIDANGDGKPDVTIVSEDGKERCRAADLDFDGRVDLYSYLDKSGALTRRELDYDRDGNVDEIQLFKNGQISEKHRSTTVVKRLDTWETYSQGRIIKAERDSDGNGRIDQWWDYKTADCPLIRSDVDGNGEPDPSSQVDFCSEAGYKPPEAAAPATAPMLQKDTQALPTETSNKVDEAPAAEGAGKERKTEQSEPSKSTDAKKEKPNE